MNLQSTERREQVRLVSRFLYVCSKFPRGLTPRAYQQLIMRRPHLRDLGWELKRSTGRELLRAVRSLSIESRIELDAWPLAVTSA